MTDEPETCAVWYWRHLHQEYELCDDEQSAAEFAVKMETQESGYVDGVQFRDGRAVKREDWEMYGAVLARREEARHRQWVDIGTQMPSRQVRSPFGQAIIRVNADEPDWLGIP